MKKFALPTAVLLSAALLASSCASDETALEQPEPTAAVASEPVDVGDMAVGIVSEDDGATSIEASELADELDALPVGELSEAEIDGLALMREEEKLAGDVYTAMYELWGLQIFDNIASAEATHTDAVKTLLDRYEIDDPAQDLDRGEFINPDLQALYDELVERGSESLTDALMVGATIEDLDIFDLQALTTENAAIDLVYSNLERGSRNHMRAFVGQLDRQGAEYVPSYLTQEQFDDIVNTPTEQGSGEQRS